MSAIQLMFSRSTAHDIFKLCDGLQVERIDTQANTAKMIDLKAIWNRTAKHFVRDTVSVIHLGQSKLAVIVFGVIFVATGATHPDPASGPRHHFNETHESVRNGLERKLIVSHVISFGSLWLGVSDASTSKHPALLF